MGKSLLKFKLNYGKNNCANDGKQGTVTKMHCFKMLDNNSMNKCRAS